jgi:hypothetical protein
MKHAVGHAIEHGEHRQRGITGADYFQQIETVGPVERYSEQDDIGLQFLDSAQG